MYKFILYFVVLVIPAPLTGSVIIVEQPPSCSSIQVNLSLPIDTFANIFLLEKVPIQENQAHFFIENNHPIGFLLQIPQLEVYYSLYIHPKDTIIISLNNNCELKISSNKILNILPVAAEFRKIIKEYLDKRIFYPDDYDVIFEQLSKEVDIITNRLSIQDSVTLSLYIRDFLLTRVGSIFRQMRSANLLEPELMDSLFNYYSFSDKITYSLSNYSYYFYSNYFKNSNINKEIVSNYFQDNYFLFVNGESALGQFVITFQYIGGMKSNILNLMGEECLAYLDAKEFVNLSVFRDLLTQYGEDCN